MTKSQLLHDLEMIVSWGDCDAAGISYYARYFEWFTNGYMQLLSHYGLPYMNTFYNNGISLVCLKAESQYKKILKPLETITVRTFLTSCTRTRMVFSYKLIKENGDLSAEGKTSHAFVNKNGLPINLKKHFPEIWKTMESICT